MIPSVLASQFREGLTDYVETTFPITSPVFEGSIRRFLEKKDAFFHEPFVSVKLPFRVAEHGNERFEAIHSDYAPYVHQNKAFDRLDGVDPRSTLVATGTGSGKTECFLYPVLEYCYQHRGEQGIKALIIYPMNALASDQALRLAKLIHGSPELRGNVTAGMYVGGMSKHESKTMQADKIITDHETLLNNPPDILLTNYKMLDYLLVRPNDATLWEYNKDPETLRYVIVDELHTFDGAQGTDLACLIRRLKSRLKIQPGWLCCVGTSATMGGPESMGPMLEYAKSIFGEPFESDSIITEDRLHSHEFFDGAEVSYHHMPEESDAEHLSELARNEDQTAYIRYAADCWFDEADRIDNINNTEGQVELGRRLMSHTFFQSLMGIMDARVMQPSALCDELSNVFPIMATNAGAALLDSMLALISHARSTDVKGNARPFLQVQLQIWMRELRRVLGLVNGERSDFMLEADINRTKADRSEHYLPVVNCRDCGATGWAGTLDERSQLRIRDMKVFYNQYFAFDKRIRMVFPRREDDGNAQIHTKYRFCPQCLYVQFDEGSDKCGCCGHKTFPVWMPDIAVNKQSGSYACPFCGGTHSIMLVGLRSATAISAGISQLYGSKFNDDKKLLAFNDNVQDAAHRASFFNARTWHFELRTAIQHFICDGGEGLDIESFGSKLCEYYLEKMDETEFIDTFIPHNMAGDRAYENLQKYGEFPDEAGRVGLLNDVRRRLAYECVLEYGMNSRIGRTLEKSCASMIVPDVEPLRAAAEAALVRIENEAGIRDLNAEQLLGYLYAWLEHMRRKGAFALPIYEQYVAGGGKYYTLTQKHIHWLPGAFSLPEFTSLESRGGADTNFETLSPSSWYMRRFCALIGKTPIECPGMIDAVSILLSEMLNHGILRRMEGPKGLPVFGIAPEVYHTTRDIAQIRCDVCGAIISCSRAAVAFRTGTPCDRKDCSGHYQPHLSGEDYYANLYRNGDLVRIHAREHTGLLQRDDREQLETQFKHKKQDHQAWDPNLLSCTPTLEMGIDIGDLSTVVLCSIPPAQSQYLQRIGRAGRTDGNALTVAVAGSKPHDLYFYQDPMEMIAGQVDPPGIFLNASAVLERQFVAFCFDNWVKSGIPESAIPQTVKGVLPKVKAVNEPIDAFPFNLLNYIKTHMSSLIRMFEAMFDRDDLTMETKERIRAFAKGNGLQQESLRSHILTSFVELYDQRESLRKDIKKLKAAIDDLESKPKDASYEQTIKELRMERMGVSNVVQSIENKNTFNFLSDEGLLPNYAFPEAGIILKAILTRRADPSRLNEDSDSAKLGYERYSYEYSRGAGSAISEFAPENSFYVGGHKLSIDQVDVNTTQPEQWRMCPNCDHAAPVSSLHDVSACPRCGCVEWADQGQVRTMLKVRTVYSNNSYEASRSGDESDDRVSKFYSKQMLVDIDESKDVTKGFQTVGGMPFGYEFVSKATLREINFGESDSIGTRLTVAGHQDIRNGFKLCKFCGKIQPRGLKSKPVHVKTCRAETQNIKEPFEECMFLYREFTSEAIRILVPATSMDTTSTKMESFAAAIMLGLRKKFNNVDHLNYCIMEAPVNDADYRKQYMVIYDSVPGGTGYLKELTTNAEALMDVFELALHAMETCSCNADQNMDGCYHCLYAYRQSNKINNISRRCAEDLLRNILANRHTLKPNKGVSQIAVNTLFDSELEKRFIEAIAQTSTPSRKVEITKVPVNGKEGYFLQIGPCCWEVELQVPFGDERHVTIKSKPDFVFYPKSAGNTQKKIAVFTDGFVYHKDRIADDSNKRLAIRENDEYRVWSLTWSDIQEFLDGKVVPESSALDPEAMPNGKFLKQIIRDRDLPAWNLKTLSSFEMLIRYLSEPNSEKYFTGYAQGLAFAMTGQKISVEPAGFAAWQEKEKVLHELNSEIQACEFKKYLIGEWKPYPALRMFASIANTAAKTRIAKDGKKVPVFDEKEARLLIRFDDTIEDKDKVYERSWRDYLAVTNLMQFCGTYLFVTEDGLEKGIYDWYRQKHEPIITDADTGNDENDAAWDALIHNELYDDAAISLANQLKYEKCSLPDTVGYEIDGEVFAEMVWEDKKIAIQLEDQAEFADLLRQNGWNVYAASDAEAIKALKEV